MLTMLACQSINLFVAETFQPKSSLLQTQSRKQPRNETKLLLPCVPLIPLSSLLKKKKIAFASRLIEI